MEESTRYPKVATFLLNRIQPTGMSPNSIEYRIAPELRRCCWYGIFGLVLIVGVSILIQKLVQLAPRPNSALLITALVVSACLAFLISGLRWRLRVDQEGIATGIFFRRELWTWSDFASGRIRKSYPDHFSDPQRPWWRRRLNLSYLENDDRFEVISAINMRYVLPPPPEVPPTLEIKYAILSAVNFNDRGIKIKKGKKSNAYEWTDLVEVHFTRTDPLRRDFASLVITLPDQEIEFKLVSGQGGATPNWRGATAEELNEYLMRAVPTDRIGVSIRGQEPNNIRELERRIKTCENSLKSITSMMIILYVLLVIFVAWIVVQKGLWVGLAMAFMFSMQCLMVHCVYFSVRQNLRKLMRQHIKLTQALDELAAPVRAN